MFQAIRSLSIWSSAALLVTLLSSSARAQSSTDDRVQLEQAAPAVTRRMFLPWNPFEEKPTLEPGQKALTQFFFKLSAGADDVKVLETKVKHARCLVEVDIKKLRLKLSLPVVIWTPHGAPQKCLRHEEGHRIIAERIYEFSDDIIRYLAGTLLTRSFRGEGGDRTAAVRDAIERATTELNQSYRAAVLDYSKQVTDEYDRITNHGLADISVDDAIAQAFESCGPQMNRLMERNESDRAQSKNPPAPTTRLGKPGLE